MQFHPKRKREARLQGVESLETRSLLSGVPVGTLGDADPADTLDQATPLGVLTSTQVAGSIDQNGSDVDWFAFTLQFPSSVTLEGNGATFSLYNSAATTDALGVGYRLLSQATADGSDPATLTRDLAAGTYYVAVSGVGNTFFHPLIANSGFPGQAGDYSFDLSSTQIDTSASTDPVVLSVDASSLGFRVDLSDALDFAPTVTLSSDNGTPLAVASIQQNAATNEIVIVPASPLRPGHYRAEVNDPSGNTRLSLEFDVPETWGSEAAGGDDTAATSNDLGELNGAGLVQVGGVIGDDPYYGLAAQAGAHFAGNDVDLYHFHVDATQSVALQAEVFAGRIGSTLNTGLTLYRLNPQTGSLEWVTANDNSHNPFQLADGSEPLLYDSVMLVGLSAGDYYLAVSSGKNAVTPTDVVGNVSTVGELDPTRSHSASNGTSVGQYVLNVQVVPLADNKPEVVDVSIDDGAELPSAPSTITVNFSEFMDLTTAAYASLQSNGKSSIPGVFIRDASGQVYYPTLQSFDPQTFQASFIMLSRLRPGHYELHLSGSQGLKDLSGNPLVGNSASGDYVVSFKVNRNQVGTNGNPQVWTHDPATDATDATQNLGTLFPDEVVAGVEIDRPGSKSKDRKVDGSDDYQFQVLQNGTYVFRLAVASSSMQLSLTDADGNVVDVAAEDNAQTLFARLNAGTYTVHVTNHGGNLVPGLSYHVTVIPLDTFDNAPPLSIGPAPTVGMKLNGMSDPVDGGGTGGGTGGGQTGGGSTGTIGGSPRSIGTISGGSSGATFTSTPGFLSFNSGASRLNLSDAQQGFIIAIPTVTGQSGTSGLILRANRAGRLGPAERDTLAPRGLSSLADGPVGRDGGIKSLLNRSDVGGSSLQALINSALSEKKNIAADESSNSQDNRDSNPADTDASENADQADGAITASEQAGGIDPSHSASRKAPKYDPGFLLHTISMLYDTQEQLGAGVETVSQTQADEDYNSDPSLIVSAEEYSAAEGAAVTSNDHESGSASHLTDNLFAAGLALLMSDLFLPRNTDENGRKGLGQHRRHGSRRTTKLCEQGEDSGV